MIENLAEAIVVAARWRAAGAAWWQAAEKVGWPPEVVERWPVEHPNDWAAAEQVAEDELAVEVGREARATLRTCLREKDMALRLQAAKQLFAVHAKRAAKQPVTSADPFCGLTEEQLDALDEIDTLELEHRVEVEVQKRLQALAAPADAAV